MLAKISVLLSVVSLIAVTVLGGIVYRQHEKINKQEEAVVTNEMVSDKVEVVKNVKKNESGISEEKVLGEWEKCGEIQIGEKEGLDKRNLCYDQVSFVSQVNMMSLEICESIEKENVVRCKDAVYMFRAFGNNNSNECAKIKDDVTRKGCKDKSCSVFAEMKLLGDLCEKKL